MPNIRFEDFLSVDIRVGTVRRAENFTEVNRPAIKLWIDFGSDIGLKKSSAQITDLYTPSALVGRQVLAVINFPPKQIANFMSEVLVLGLQDSEGRVVLVQPQSEVPNGKRVH